MSLGQLLTLLLLVLFAGLGFFYWWGHHAPTVDTTAPPITGDYDITAADTGKSFEYPETSRFTVYLDQTKYKVDNLACSPDGIIGSISNVPAVAYPLVAKRFEVLASGTCTLTDGDFSVRIIGKD